MQETKYGILLLFVSFPVSSSVLLFFSPAGVLYA